MHEYEFEAFFVKSATTKMAMMQNCQPTSDKCNMYRKYNWRLFHLFFYFVQQNCNVINAILDVTSGATETVAVSKQTQSFSL